MAQTSSDAEKSREDFLRQLRAFADFIQLEETGKLLSEVLAKISERKNNTSDARKSLTPEEKEDFKKLGSCDSRYSSYPYRTHQYVAAAIRSLLSPERMPDMKELAALFAPDALHLEQMYVYVEMIRKHLKKHPKALSLADRLEEQLMALGSVYNHLPKTDKLGGRTYGPAYIMGYGDWRIIRFAGNGNGRPILEARLRLSCIGAILR